MTIDIDNALAHNCLICEDAPCNKGCYKGIDIANIIRSLYFYNMDSAADQLGDKSCLHCDAPCLDYCVRPKNSHQVNIKNIITAIEEYKAEMEPNKIEDVSLKTNICGVELENPFLLSSSVVASTYDMCKRAFEAGWAGAALKTISSFEQHEASPRFSCQYGRDNCFGGFKNIEQLSDHSTHDNFEMIKQLKSEFPTKVIVASIMGRNTDEWTWLARKCEEAGADVIECNFSCPNLEEGELGVTIGQSEELIERFTKAAKKECGIPVLAKLTPNVADMAPYALAAKRGGADGIAAINTINSITGVGLVDFSEDSNVKGKSIVGGYSGRAVKPIALRFISDLSNCKELENMPISGMGGIESWWGATEFILLGCASLQITTAVMEYGYRIIDDLIDGLERYMKWAGFATIDEMVGYSKNTIVDHDDIERDSILLPKFDHDKCIGCGRCYVSCRDGGHQAIEFDTETRKPKLIAKKCVGCHLCRLVCSQKAIGTAKKRFTRS